jgi:hypothetical protein
MDKEALIRIYKQRNTDENEINHAIEIILEFEKYLFEKHIELNDVPVNELQIYIDYLIKSEKNSIGNLLALARYYYVIGNKEIYIYFTRILGGLGVVENIRDRTRKYVDENIAKKIFDSLDEIPLGTDPKDVPVYTKELIRRIKEYVSDEMIKKILAGNNHQIPAEAMYSEKEFYEKSHSLEDYLKDRHARKVQELQAYCDEGKVWFEQVITQDVVDHVKENQEILSAILKNNKLYVTKIPYETEKFLGTDTDAERRYHTCHCPFVREAIKLGLEVDSDWCYCSAGFAKYPFEIILNRELSVKVIETPLSGSDICRFEIDLDL